MSDADAVVRSGPPPPMASPPAVSIAVLPAGGGAEDDVSGAGPAAAPVEQPAEAAPAAPGGESLRLEGSRKGAVVVPLPPGHCR